LAESESIPADVLEKAREAYCNAAKAMWATLNQGPDAAYRVIAEALMEAERMGRIKERVHVLTHTARSIDTE
jgi:hypothetical protein